MKEAMVLRPSVAQLLRALRLRGAAVLLVLFLVNIGNLAFFVRHPGRALLTAVTTILVAGFAVLWHGLYLLNVSLAIGTDGMRWTNRFGRRKVFPRNDIVGVARRILRVATWGPPLPEIAIVYGHKHHCLVRLPSIYWDLETVDLLADRLGVRILGPRTVSRAELGKEFPGVVSRAQRLGPWAVTVGVALVGVGLIVAFGR